MATIPLGLYLWLRIREVGVESIFGLPGDFNLNFLDYIQEVDGLHWIGNANELNAAYAADGYARVKGVPGCLVTTHGVGELSALNGIAGAAAEHVPVIHIVGQTPRKVQENHLMIHHSVGTRPDHQLYNKISERLRCAAAELWDPATAPAQIDNAIRECFIQKLPAYIFFPLDMTYEQVPISLLDTRLDLSLPVNVYNEKAALEETLLALVESHNPSIFIDHLVRSHGKPEAQKLIEVFKAPLYASHMAKGLVDEDHPRYMGLYNGNVSATGIAESIESSDLVLALGWWVTDTNTAAFTRNLSVEKRIDVMDTYVVVRGKTFEGVYMAPFLRKLATELENMRIQPVDMPLGTRFSNGLSNGHTNGHVNGNGYANGYVNGHANGHTNGHVNGKTNGHTNGHVNGNSSPKIKQTYIWKRIAKFLQPGDVLIGETGTAAFGFPDATFPKDITYVTQLYYGSIGYATACALGADLALRELHAANPSSRRRRTVLVTGDGSLQLTVQEIGTMIMRGLQPIIIVINNNGYTIERAIHGARASYNDIAQYNFQYMLSFFGGASPVTTSGKKGSVPNYRCASTVAEFEAVCDEEELQAPTTVQVVEVRMDDLDIPWRLAKLLINRDGDRMIDYFTNEGFSYENLT